MAAETELVGKLYRLQLEEDSILEELERVRENRRKLLDGEVSASPVLQQTTIDSLPPEVLLVIFKMACAFNYDDWDCSQSQVYVKTPIGISHVCRLWRSLARSTGTLWSFACFSHERLARVSAERSGLHLLDAVRTLSSPLTMGSAQATTARITSTYPRWRSLFWQFNTNAEFQWFVPLLFTQPPSTNLRRLELQYEERDMKIRRGISSTVKVKLSRKAPPQLPALEELNICNIHLKELPTTLFSHSLRVLSIGSSNCAAYAENGFYISRLCALLRETPGLQELVLKNCVPRWDICLVTDTDTDDMQLTAQQSSALVQVRPVGMLNLRRLGWSLAPPKCLHHLLFVLGCSELEELYIGLDLHTAKWPNPAAQQWYSQPPLRPFELPRLRILDISSRDASGLTYAVKKLSVPALERFVFSRFGSKNPIHRADQEERKRQGCTWSPTSMPSWESIFHEPRLVHLTHLEISGCVIRKDHIGSMLVYMPSLESLSFNDCEGIDLSPGLLTVLLILADTTTCAGVDAVMCALSGAGSCRSPLVGPRKWPCPQLTKIVLTQCDDVQFSCLADTIMARKRYAEGSVPMSLKPASSTRSIKPLKRKFAMQTDHSVSPSATPPRATVASRALETVDSLSSPNGSFVAGWTAHEHITPLPIEVVRVEDCQRITEAELRSLQEEFGVHDAQ